MRVPFIAWGVFCGIFWFGDALKANSTPVTTFDISYTIPCSDVTTENYAKANPNSRLIEAKFRVSTDIAGAEKDIKEMSVEIISPDRRLHVVDFMPKTQLGSSIDGDVEISESVDNGLSFTGAIKPQLSVQYKDPTRNLTAGAAAANVEATKSKKNGVTKKYKLVPDKELLVASGSTNRGHGVFFKLKPSTQRTLQGWTEFAVIFEVDAGWKSDWVIISVGATAMHSNLLHMKKEVKSGFKQVHVGMHLQGEVDAKQQAEHLGDVQEKYLEVIAKQTKTDSELFFERMTSAGHDSGIMNFVTTHAAAARMKLKRTDCMCIWWRCPDSKDFSGSSAPEKQRVLEAEKALKDALDSLSSPAKAAAQVAN